MKRAALAAFGALLCAALAWFFVAVPGEPAPPPVAVTEPVAALEEPPPPAPVEVEAASDGGEDDALFGTVLDAAGNPAAGADVIVTRVAAELLGVPECAAEEDDDALCLCGPLGAKLVAALERLPAKTPVLAQTRTDAEGRFRIAPSPDALDYRVTASLGGSRASDRAVVWEELELRLSAPTRHEVRVTDGDEQPIAGATVLLLGEPPQRTTTDARGVAHVSVLDGEVELFVFAPGRLPASEWFRGDESGEEPIHELMLPAARRVAGRVMGDGAAVAGAQVTLDASDCVFSAVTGPGGGFAFENVPAAKQLITARADARAAAVQADVSNADRLDVVLRLGNASSIEGHVLDEDNGEPIAGAAVTFRHIGHDPPQDLETSTAENGGFRFDTVLLGPGWLHVSKRDYVPLMRQLAVAPSGVNTVELLLDHGGELAGVVLDGMRRPVERAEVRAGQWHSTVSGADGTFKLRVVEGAHRVSVTTSHHVPWSGELVAPRSGLEIVLGGGGTIEGEVVDARGAPVAGVSVYSDRSRGPTLPAPGLRQSVSDAAGHFRLTGIAPGTWRVKAVSDDGGPETTATMRDAEVQHVKLTFKALTRLHGRVVDRAGQPIAAAAVYASCSPRHERAVSDAAGQFAFEKVEIGDCRVGFSTERYAASPSVKVEVTAQTPPITLVANRSALLRGRVVDEDGSPIERVRLTIGAGYRGLETPGGSFEVAAGPPAMSIWVEDKVPVELPRAPADGPDVELGTLVLRDGRQVRAVVRDVAGEPVAAATFWLDSRTVGSSGPDGTALLSGLPAEDRELEVRHTDFRRAKVSVSASQEHVDVVLHDGAVVRGRLVGADAPEQFLALAGSQWSAVDEDGDFVLSGLDPGLVHVTARDRRGGKIIVPPVSVTVSMERETEVELHANVQAGPAPR